MSRILFFHSSWSVPLRLPVRTREQCVAHAHIAVWFLPSVSRSMSFCGPRRERQKEAGRLKEERDVQGRRDRNNTGSTRIVAQLDVRRLVRPVLSFALELLILVSSVCWVPWGGWKKGIGAVLVAPDSAPGPSA